MLSTYTYCIVYLPIHNMGMVYIFIYFFQSIGTYNNVNYTYAICTYSLIHSLIHNNNLCIICISVLGSPIRDTSLLLGMLLLWILRIFRKSSTTGLKYFFMRAIIMIRLRLTKCRVLACMNIKLDQQQRFMADSKYSFIIVFPI